MRETTQNIAARLRALREDSGETVDTLAAHLDIPVDRYRAYENGDLDIPASELKQAAQRLRVDTGLLLTGERPRLASFAVTRAGQGPSVARRADYGYENLAANFHEPRFEPFVVTIPPSADEAPIPENAHPGQEFNFLLEGRIQLRIHGRTLTLEPGDSILFDARQPHGMKALDGRPARFVAVIAE